MKRGMAGGTHRGPVALSRQRRTIRLVQLLLVVIAAALLMFSGYSLGRVSGFEAGRRSQELESSPKPSLTQVMVLGVLGTGALVAAVLLQGNGGVRMPTPARLDDLAGIGPERVSDVQSRGDLKEH